MIVPRFWAEGRIQERFAGKQFTVRRWGWSDTSPLAAQAHADQRTREAFERIVRGEKIERRERKVAYDGADGMPIREEIVERHGDAIVTRNSYGARCLNTPDVLFADIDIDVDRDKPRRAGLGTVIGAALIGAVVTGYAFKSPIAAGVAFVGVLSVGLWRLRVERPGEAPSAADDPEAVMQARIERFIVQRPEWHLRLYRTPAGFRVLAMHDVFGPGDAAVADLFQALETDPVYARMCRHQNCFRARLSAKPWRIGITEPLRPRPGVWPIDPERMPARDAWVATYEQAAQSHAACRFVGGAGNLARVHPNAQAVQQVHDALTRATSGLPLA